jgi:hypothetical protein
VYRKVDPKFWSDAKVRRVSDDGRYVFLFVLTHPSMTALGAMRATGAGLAAELGWPVRRFRRALMESVAQGMVEINDAAAYVGLPNFLRYNEPNGPNAVTGAWPRALDLIPECPERQRLVARCCRYLESRSDAFRKAIGDGIWDALRDGMSHGPGDGLGDPGAGAGAGTGTGTPSNPRGDIHPATPVPPGNSDGFSAREGRKDRRAGVVPVRGGLPSHVGDVVAPILERIGSPAP